MDIDPDLPFVGESKRLGISLKSAHAQGLHPLQLSMPLHQKQLYKNATAFAECLDMTGTTTEGT